MPSVFTLSGPRAKPRKRGRGLGDIAPGELHLVMVNEGSIYRELQDLRARGAALACKAGKFERNAIAQLFTGIAQREAAKLDRKAGRDLPFGELPRGDYRRQVLEASLEFADDLKASINFCKKHPQSCDLSPAVAAMIKRGCKIPAGGFAGAKRRRRR